MDNETFPSVAPVRQERVALYELIRRAATPLLVTGVDWRQFREALHLKAVLFNSSEIN